MARGKHAGNPEDSFEDTSSYRSRREHRDVQTSTKLEEKNDNIADNVENNTYGTFSNREPLNANMLGDDFLSFEDEESTLNYKKIILVIGIIVVLIIAGFLVYKFVFTKEEIQEPAEPVVSNEAKMIETFAGCKVLGKIVIDDIKIEQYILDSTSDNALENGVGKLYGGSLNNYGNLCLIGHNFEDIFEKLSELEVGDKIKLVDRELEETTYKINNIFSIEPDNLECLLQDETKVELTLITCETGAATRLVVKAEEVDENDVDIDENANTVDSNTVNVNTENTSKENV